VLGGLVAQVDVPAELFDGLARVVRAGRFVPVACGWAGLQVDFLPQSGELATSAANVDRFRGGGSAAARREIASQARKSARILSTPCPLARKPARRAPETIRGDPPRLRRT